MQTIRILSTSLLAAALLVQPAMAQNNPAIPMHWMESMLYTIDLMYYSLNYLLCNNHNKYLKG